MRKKFQIEMSVMVYVRYYAKEKQFTKFSKGRYFSTSWPKQMLSNFTASTHLLHPFCKKKKTTRSRHIESHYNGVLAFAGSQYTALVLKTDSHPLTLHMGF